MTRKIIHVDCDCFYAAVEARDDPALRGKPLGVGGSADGRGVICTASYEARRYGVRSAMPARTALKLCPDLILMPPNMEKYREESRKIRAIFGRYTDVIEPLSLDEAFLDVSDSEHFQGSATRIAEKIRADVANDLQITVSAGVAPNKFLAKVASDWQKPDGLTVVSPERVEAFVANLPVNKIPGVGPVTASKLKELGIEYCHDVRSWSAADLSLHFGKFGPRLLELSSGQDERPVQSRGHRKSLSVERTYGTDLPDRAACKGELEGLLKRLNQRMDNLPRSARIAGQFVKLRASDFRSTTVDRQLNGEVDDALFAELLEEAWGRFELPVRLLGVGLRFAPRTDLGAQLPLPFKPS